MANIRLILTPEQVEYLAACVTEFDPGDGVGPDLQDMAEQAKESLEKFLSWDLTEATP